ncbi:MAG: hypothetical protein EHM87_25205, partial [Burkholderiales bacterium]
MVNKLLVFFFFFLITYLGNSTTILAATQLTLTPANELYNFSGWGGNICWGNGDLDTGSVRYFNELDVKIVRLRLALNFWGPSDQNSFNTHYSVSNLDLTYFDNLVRNNPQLQQTLNVAKRAKTLNIPIILSSWDPPAYPTDKLSVEMHQVISTFIMYAYERYGANIDYYSFNEADIGINVLFSKEEHRDFIKGFGNFFKNNVKSQSKYQNLKTKLLLGDVGKPFVFRNPWPDYNKYWEPTINDPQAMSYVGAVSVHTYNKGDALLYPDQPNISGGNEVPISNGYYWREGLKWWSQVAKDHNLPLILAEVGTDGSAPSESGLHTWDYALKDLQTYIGGLYYGQPESMLYWSYIENNRYSLYDSANNLTPDSRFWFIKQLGNILPNHAKGIQTTISKDPPIYLVAFKGDLNGQTQYVLHLANFSSTDQAVSLAGVPTGTYEGLKTSQTEKFKCLSNLIPVSGQLLNLT